jgi:hypothetical protein
MKKSLARLAHELDFETGHDYFEYCLSSYINGNFNQCKELFKAMIKNDQKAFLRYMNGEAQHNGRLQARNFFFDLS